MSLKKIGFRSFSKLLFIAWISIQSVVAGAQPTSLPKPVLEIHQNELWHSMLEQWFIYKYTSKDLSHQKFSLRSPSLRVDLSMQDLIDQVNVIVSKHFSNTDYATQLDIQDPITNFDQWYAKLNEIASKDSLFKKQLDRQLVLQQYNLDGVALTDGIKMLRLGRIRKIESYNKIALDPEGPGILERLGNKKRLTVLSAQSLSKNEIKLAKSLQYMEHYQEISRLEALDHAKYGGDTRYQPLLIIPKKIGKPLRVAMDRDEEISAAEDSRRKADERFFKHIFNATEKLPGKYHFLEAIDEEMNHQLPRTHDGKPVLTPSFIQEFETQLIPVLKEVTWRQLLSQEDDETLLLFRRWLKHHREGSPDSVKEKLEHYNQANGTQLKIEWLSKKGIPHRVDVMESYPTLVTIYQGEEPWQSDIDAVMMNKRGKEVVIGRTIVGSIIYKLGEAAKDAVKYENLAGIAAGTGVFFLSSGNIGLAAATNSIVHDVIANRKYDRNPRELLTQIPMDALGGLLTQSSVQPGRIFNVIALGMSQGLLQGVATKQDPFKSALVGATLETGLEFIPYNIRYPMLNGVSKKVLAKNAAIEVFTTSAKTAFRGGVVAVLEKRDAVKGMEKGAVYGAAVSILKIAVLGARYNPLHGTTSSDVQQMIDLENTYDNANGAPGGNYQITQKTIQQTPYRAGGWLPIQINASITLPGNVSMNADQMNIETVIHESHHLSQQEQLGLFRFYYQYIYESLTTSYWDLSFEISAH